MLIFLLNLGQWVSLCSASKCYTIHIWWLLWQFCIISLASCEKCPNVPTTFSAKLEVCWNCTVLWIQRHLEAVCDTVHCLRCRKYCIPSQAISFQSLPMLPAISITGTSTPLPTTAVTIPIYVLSSYLTSTQSFPRMSLLHQQEVAVAQKVEVLTLGMMSQRCWKEDADLVVPCCHSFYLSPCIIVL